MIPRIMLAAPKSGSGKTTLTCALIGALKNQNLKVASCKCGPDYIDPMFHRSALGITACNLDTWFTGEEETLRLLNKTSSGKDIVVMEGVMGLFDGLGGIREEGSSYHLAKVTKTPILFILDVHGMGKSMIPTIQGFLNYDTEHLIHGIILNRITKSFYETMRPLLEAELSVPVVGIFESHKDLHLESRHLGLKLPGEIEELDQQLTKAAAYFEESVDLVKILEIARGAEEIDVADGESTGADVDQIDEESITRCEEPSGPDESKIDKFQNEIVDINMEKPRLAIARDEAFCFYYEENMRLLSEKAEIVYFSPLHDKVLPKEIDGIYLGGGYPELYAKDLSENKEMLAEIRNAIENGLPSFAECGGFLYLHKTLTIEDGKFPMAGVIDAEAGNKGKLVRFGYVELSEVADAETTAAEPAETFLGPGGVIKGHEFHYYDSTDNGDSCTAKKPVGSCSWSCVHESENHWWGFPHLYLASSPHFTQHFANCMRKYHEHKQER